MARKSFGFQHEGNTETRREQVETKQLKLTKASSQNTARIHSAIENGKQTLLPCETQGQNLFKFEHNGRDGPLLVFVQEALHSFNKFGRYKVIAALKPADSLRNQLFFAKEITKTNKEVLTDSGNSHIDVKHISSSSLTKKTPVQMDNSGFIDRSGNLYHGSKKAAKTRQTNPDSFEQLIERYKSRRVMYKGLMGTREHFEVLDKLDGLYRQRKQERLKLQEQFSNLGAIRTEINISTGLRDHVKDLEDTSKEAKDLVKLPRIRVSTVAEIHKRDSRRQIDKKRLVVPKEKRTGTMKLSKLEGRTSDGQDSSSYETITVTLPKLTNPSYGKSVKKTH